MKKKPSVSLFSIFNFQFSIPLALLLLAGCGKLRESPTDPGGGTPPPAGATFTRVQTEVFSPTCARSGCHDAQFPQQSLVLSPPDAYASIVGRRSTEISTLNRVQPGIPERSYLYLKVTGGAGITGDRMPQGGPYLSQAQMDLIRDWIARGAPND